MGSLEAPKPCQQWLFAPEMPRRRLDALRSALEKGPG